MSKRRCLPVCEKPLSCGRKTRGWDKSTFTPTMAQVRANELEERGWDWSVSYNKWTNKLDKLAEAIDEQTSRSGASR